MSRKRKSGRARTRATRRRWRASTGVEQGVNEDIHGGSLCCHTCSLIVFNPCGEILPDDHEWRGHQCTREIDHDGDHGFECPVCGARDKPRQQIMFRLDTTVLARVDALRTMDGERLVARSGVIRYLIQRGLLEVEAAIAVQAASRTGREREAPILVVTRVGAKAALKAALDATGSTALHNDKLEQLLELLHDGHRFSISYRMMAGCDKSDDEQLQQLTIAPYTADGGAGHVGYIPFAYDDKREQTEIEGGDDD